MTSIPPKKVRKIGKTYDDDERASRECISPPPGRGCPALGGIVVALREPRGVRPTPTVARPPRGGAPMAPLIWGRGGRFVSEFS